MNSIAKNVQKKVLLGVFFLILAVLFFWPFLQGQISFIWDTREFGYINLHQVTAALSQGHFPLWNANNFSGYPFAGDIEAGMFYPVNWFFAWIFGAMKFSQLGYYFIFHFLLGGVLAYGLCYKLTKNAFASLIGGVVFAYSGYALGHISHLGQVVMYMWMPGVFWAYLKAFDKGPATLLSNLFNILLAGLVFALALSVGHSNTTIYLLLGLFVLTVYRMVANKEWRIDWWKTGIKSLVSTVFAFALVAVLVFPVYELTARSNRVDLTYEQQSQGWSLNPLNLLGMFDPNHNHVLSDQPMVDFNGSVDLTQNYFYIGLLPLLLIIFGLFSKNKYKWCFVFLGVLALFAAFGKYTPVNFLLFKFVPGFNKARMAVQIMAVCFFSASVLTAMGMEEMWSWIKRPRLKKFWPVIATILVVLAVFDIFYHGFDKRFYSEKISPEKVFDTAEDKAFIDGFKSDEPFRVADETNKFLPNKYEYYGLENVWGNGGIKIKKYNDLFMRLDRLHWLPISDRLYGFLNVKSANEVNHRAYFVEDFVVEKDEGKQLELLKNNKIDFTKQVVLSGEPSVYLGERVLGGYDFESPEYVKFLAKESEYLKLETFSTKDKILVLSEVDYPGWNLYVDGKAEKYMTANYTFRAVPLLGGKHVVEFKYQPESVRIGAWISVSALILFIIVGVWNFIKTKRKND